jgi:hypothetical protein
MSQSFEIALDAEFEKIEAMPERRLGSITDWFMAKIKKGLESTDLAGLSKEAFLAAVGNAYDKFVLPMDLPGPDSILDPILKQFILTLAGRLYDKFTAPQTFAAE